MQVPRVVAQPSERGANCGKGIAEGWPNDERFPVGFVEILLARTTASAITKSEMGDDELIVMHSLSSHFGVTGLVTPMSEQ